MTPEEEKKAIAAELEKIKAKYKSNSVMLDFEGKLEQVPGVLEKRVHKDYVELVLDGKTSSEQVLERLVSARIKINRFEIATPSLNEIFLKVADKDHE